MKGWIVGLAAVMILSWAVEAKAGIIVDLFDDGNTDGWTFREFDPRGPGEWSVENQVLVNNASTDWNMGLLDDLFLSDQVIETQLKTSSGYAGVSLWFHDENNWVSAFIYPFSTGLQIQEMVDGISTPFLYDHRTGNDTWYDFRVEADSGTGELAIYLDNDYLLTHQTSSLYRSGQSGVWSGNAPAYFDNFRVTSDDITPVVPEPASLAIWSVLGLVGFGAAWRRKRCSRG